MRTIQKQYHISAVVQIKVNFPYQETRYNNSHDKYKANIITKSLLSLHMMQNAETVEYKRLSSSYYLFFKTYFIILHVWMYVCAPHAYSVLELELETVLNWHVGVGN